MQRGRSFRGKSSPSNRFEFPRTPTSGVEFEPSNTCPKNFVIFDQSENKSRVMFNPALAHRFNSPNFSIPGINPPNGNDDDSVSKEDTEDIDALLSSDEEGEDEDDDDAVSTGRTPAAGCFISGGPSPDSSCSSSVAYSSPYGGSYCSHEKRKKTRKMVRTLRGIIPGGDHMDTPAVLDEAVRYLKSLKVEAKKLGIQNISNLQRNGDRK